MRPLLSVPCMSAATSLRIGGSRSLPATCLYFLVFDCCGDLRTDRDTHGELFELYAACQAEQTAAAPSVS